MGLARYFGARGGGVYQQLAEAAKMRSIRQKADALPHCKVDAIHSLRCASAYGMGRSAEKSTRFLA